VCAFVDKQTLGENDDDLSVKRPNATECNDTALPVTETESSLHQPSSPDLSHCDDDALASAENENNMNVESENTSAADGSVEAAAGVADVSTAAENLEQIADLQCGDEQDDMSLSKTVEDGIDQNERCDVAAELSAGADRDMCEIKMTADHDVLSSCSDMIIEVQDHQFSDEELQEAEKNGNDGPAVQQQSLYAKSSVEEPEFEESDDCKAVSIEQGQKTQPRVIRLNRNFRQQLSQSVDVPESQPRSPSDTQSGHKLVEKPIAVSHSLSSDALLERAKLSNVPRHNEVESNLPKPVKLGSSSRQSQASQKSAVQKNLPDKTKPRSRTGEVSAVTQESSLVTSSKSVPGERRKIEKPQSVLEDEQLVGSTEEPVQLQDQRDGSSESDSLSKTQLEILELEMRARAIKAMIRAQEEMEQQELVRKKRRSSGTTDLTKLTERQMPTPQNSVPQPQPRSIVQQQQASVSRFRGELQSLQSVVGRSIIKRAEVVRRHQRRVATQERFQQHRQFAEQRRVPQAALASQRTVRLQSESHLRPMRYVVTSEPSPRVIRFPSSRFGIPLPFSRRQRQRRSELRGNLASSYNSRGDKRRVLMSSNQRSVRLSSSSSRPT